jgi:hypothetical protein
MDWIEHWALGGGMVQLTGNTADRNRELRGADRHNTTQLHPMQIQLWKTKNNKSAMDGKMTFGLGDEGYGYGYYMSGNGRD